MSSKDPNSYIQASAETLAETLLSKNGDYAPTTEFSNFERAAEFSGSRTLGVMLGQIGIKFTRIETLSRDVYNPSPQHESLKDSLLDLAGYAIIAHAYLTASEPEKITADSINGNPITYLSEVKEETHAPRPYWLVMDDD